MTRLAERTVAWLGARAQKRVPYSAENPFLQGPYAPVPAETTETALRVTGAIPPELNGLLARIGPNPLQVANPATYHWFVGDGMVHGLRLRDGRALWYRNRWVGTDSVNKALNRPRAAGPRRGVAEAVNTNVFGHGGRIWATVEAGALPVELDGELNTLRHGYFESADSRAYTAHGHRDPETGELHAVCYDALSQNRIQYVVVDSACRVTRVVDIPVRHGPMVHDCAITASRVVVLDLPVTFLLREAMRGSSLPYAWNPRHPARVGLLPRQGAAADIRWYAVDPCFVFHPCNAYDLPDGGVALDVVVHARMFDRSRQGPEAQEVTFERWTLPPEGDRVARNAWSDRPQEFPRHDERRTGRPYRYAYTVGAQIDSREPQPLIKYDLRTGTSQTHAFGPRHIPNEAVFVPRHAGAAEDDGWLLSYVCDLGEERSDVVIVNAQDVGGEPQAVIHLPGRVPLGFHGNWIPDAA